VCRREEAGGTTADDRDIEHRPSIRAHERVHLILSMRLRLPLVSRKMKLLTLP